MFENASCSTQEDDQAGKISRLSVSLLGMQPDKAAAFFLA